MMESVLRWVITYAIHSTLLITTVWIITKAMDKRALPVQEQLWKAAILGALFTASLQSGVPISPINITWPSTDTKSAQISTWSPPAAAQSPAPVIAASNPAPVKPAPRVQAQPSRDLNFDPVPSALTLLAMISCLLCAHLALSYFWLHRKLSGRTDITTGPLPLTLARILSGHLPQPVRLTTTRGAKVPMALGLLKPEICVPHKTDQLPACQQENLLAHEAAHIIHRDPAWLMTARIVESLFFFQPLNRLARREIQKLAEFRCDDWAATQTGRPKDLARCLTEVAEWNLPSANLVPGISGKPSELSTRVLRLLDSGSTRHWQQASWLKAVLPVALITMALFGPGFANPKDQSDSSSAVQETVSQPPTPATPVSFVAEPTPAPEPAASPVAVPRAQRPTTDLRPQLALPIKAQAPPASPTPVPVASPKPALASIPPAPVVEPQKAVDEDHYEDVIDLLLENHEEQFEMQSEHFEEQVEAAFERIEDRLDNNTIYENLLSWRAERIENNLEHFEERLEVLLEKQEDKLEAMESSYEDRLDLLSGRPESEFTEMITDLKSDLAVWEAENEAIFHRQNKKLKRMIQTQR